MGEKIYFVWFEPWYSFWMLISYQYSLVAGLTFLSHFFHISFIQHSHKSLQYIYNMHITYIQHAFNISNILQTFLQHSCNIHTTCIQHSYSIHTTSMQHSYNIHTTFMQHSYNIHTTFIQHSYNIYATFIQHSYNIRTTFIQHTKSINITTFFDILTTFSQHPYNTHALSIQSFLFQKFRKEVDFLRVWNILNGFIQVDKYSSKWEKRFSVVVHQHSFSDYQIFYSTHER